MNVNIDAADALMNIFGYKRVTTNEEILEMDIKNKDKEENDLSDIVTFEKTKEKE